MWHDSGAKSKLPALFLYKSRGSILTKVTNATKLFCQVIDPKVEE